MRAVRAAASSTSSKVGALRLVAPSLALIVLLAATWVVAGIALQGAGVGVVSAGRTGFATVGMLLLVAFTRERATDLPSIPPYTAGQLSILALTGVAGYTMLSTLAIALAGPAIPSLILALSPVVVLLLESALAKTRVRPLVLLATVVAIIGATLYIAPGLGGAAGTGIVGGAVAAVGAMACMSVYGLYFAHVNRGHQGSMLPRLLPIFALGSIPLVVWAVIEVVSGGRIEPVTVVVLAILGLGIYVPAYLLQHRLILTAGASYAALLGLAVPPVVGLASAVFGLAAPPVPVQVCGVVLTLVGMLVVLRVRFARPH